MDDLQPSTNPTITSRVQLAAKLDNADTDGYLVDAITAGQANGLHYTPAVIEKSLPLWEGISVYVDHAGPADWGRPGGRSIRDLAGVFHSVAWDANRKAVVGRLKLLPSCAWLEAIINDCITLSKQGKPSPNLGLSADIEVERKGDQVIKINQVYSLDVVMNPARGGRFRLAQDQTERIFTMSETPDNLQPSTLQPEITTSRVTLKDPDPVIANPVASPAEQSQSQPQIQGLTAEQLTAAALDRFKLEAGEALLSVKLAQTQIPASFKELLLNRFKGKPYDPAELDKALTDTETAYARFMEQHTIKNLGAIQQVIAPVDRLQLALERLFGLPIPEAATDIPRLSGFREFYILCTGDYEMTGTVHPERVSLANITTSSMTSMVKNALNKLLLAGFEMRPFWWKPIVWEEDFPTINDVTWITAGGFADLPTVTEGGEYTELANLTDIEETSAFLKKGAYTGITLEAIDRDDVGLIRALPRKLGLAANRTLSAAIAAIFTSNSGVGPTLGQDSTALFHTNHANLATGALSTTTWDAAIQAMFKQTEPASGKRLGLRPAYLIVPIELEYTALQIIESAEFTGGTTTVLTVHPRYKSAGVVVAPEFTDTNDWAAVANPADAPGICVGYRYGRTPELFVAQDPLTGSMFTADTMRIKVRFYYTVGIGEYRALYKANVA